MNWKTTKQEEVPINRININISDYHNLYDKNKIIVMYIHNYDKII